jgi:hypothetical protein
MFAVYYGETVFARRQKGCCWQLMFCTADGGVTFPRKLNLNVTAFMVLNVSQEEMDIHLF